MAVLERVYEIGRVFRNEGLDTRHNPEFTLMELISGLYRLPRHDGSDRELIPLYRKRSNRFCKILTYGEHTDGSWSKPFERITMVDAVKKYAEHRFQRSSG